MADEGKNIRSVIKNTTMGGMSVKGSGDTIATKEEINQSKAKPETPKMSVGPNLGLSFGPKFGINGQGLNLKKAQNTEKSEVVSQPKVNSGIQSTDGGVSVSQIPPVNSPFQNLTNQPINNINVEQFNNEGVNKGGDTWLNLRKGVQPQNKLKELEKDRKKRMSKGVENLYIDAYNKSVNGGELTIEDVLGNKNYQQQLKGIDEKVLASMIEDANFLASGDYDTENVLALMDKYKDLGLSIDLDDLPPKTKAQYIAANLEGNDGGLAGLIDHISPLNILGGSTELVSGKNPRDYTEQMQQWAEENKQDFLTDDELKYMISDQVKNLDKEYKDYYYNQMEEMFTDKRVGEQFYEDVAKLRKKNKGMSEEEAVAKVMKEGKYNGRAYEDFPHETVDQGRFWNDKSKEKEYNKRLKELEKGAKEAHGDTTRNWWKNLGLDATLVVGQGLDLVRNPGSLMKGLFKLGKGAIHKSVEGYADLLDTWIATTDSAIGAIKGENEWNGIEYKVGDVGEKVANKKGYDSYDAMVERMERESEDNPSLKIATWFLKQGRDDIETANAFGDYLKASYGSLENAEQMAKENPVQMASDIISIIQLGTMGAAKMGLIDAKKAEDIVRIAGYGDLYEQTLKWGNKLQFGPVLKGEMAVLKGAKKVVGAPFRWTKPVIETFVNRLSGITKEERDLIRENPELAEKYLTGKENSQGLLDRIKDRFDTAKEEKKMEGEIYEEIKKSDKPVKISGILDDISKVLKKNGLELTDDGIKINKQFSKAGVSKINELSNYINDLRNLGNSAKGENVHWTRQLVDGITEYDKDVRGADAVVNNMLKDIRTAIDNGIRRDIPALKEVDARYVKTLNEIKELRQDWIDKDGNLKDSAYSRIRNLTKKGANEPKLAKLEKLLPGISEELRGLAVAESIEKAGKQMVGQYASQIFGVGGGIAAITGLLTGGFSAGPLILGTLGATLATPRNLVKLLKFQGKISKGFNSIIDKLANGITLNPRETVELTKYLNDNQDALKKDSEYLFRKGEITDEEYKQALKNKEKEVKKTGNGEKNEYSNKDNLNSNQNKDGRIEEGKNDTRKSQERVGGLAKKEKGANQGGIGQKASGKAWNDGGRVSQGDGGYLELKTDGEEIVKTLRRIKGEQPEGFKMDIHGADKYGNGKWKTFQSADGNSSVTVKDDGDITSLVSKKGLGRGKELVLTAIKNGGDKLDCFEDKLPGLYQKAGFEPVARVKWNADYKPEGWKGEGQDIIVMMRRNNDSVEKVAENWDKYEKIDLDDLPVKEYEEALAYRDMLLAERKKGYSSRKIETTQETANGLKKKKEFTGKIKPVWEEVGITEEQVNNKMEEIKNRYIGDKKKLRELYNDYVKKNIELGKDLQGVFMKDGYLNPDGLRPLINQIFAKEMGVSDNIMASTNHPAVSKIADAFVEMVGDDMIEKAKKGENINVALIGGGGGSGKSGGPKAMISEGFVKEGEKVDMTLDVQGGANDLKALIEKARDEGVLDKFNFKIAYVYASTEDAGKGVINRTISQNIKGLEKKGLNPDVVAKDTDIGKDRVYVGRTLPFKIFEQGHLKSVGEKGLAGYINIAKDIDDVEFMITERIPGDRKNTKKYIVKQGGEWKMTEKELNDLATRMTKNKEAGLNWAELEKEGQKAVKEGKISKRQYANLFGRMGAFAFLLMVLGGGDGQEA